MTVLPSAQTQRRPAAPAGPFKTTLTAAEMTNKQAVVETTVGSFVIDLRPDLAPNHVGYFMKLAKEGAYNGTTFHRVIKYGIVQGGDPLSKDPSKAKLYGTGGLGMLKLEPSAEKTIRRTRTTSGVSMIALTDCLESGRVFGMSSAMTAVLSTLCLRERNNSPAPR